MSRKRIPKDPIQPTPETLVYPSPRIINEHGIASCGCGGRPEFGAFPGSGYVWLGCSSCELEGPLCMTGAEAKAKWNRAMLGEDWRYDSQDENKEGVGT